MAGDSLVWLEREGLGSYGTGKAQSVEREGAGARGRGGTNAPLERALPPPGST